ncbi:hypothetical protein [Stenotrophomonas sp. PD6]|uniref:hypothetical protein n=1 Tax=Stenotrophomonas sp. PD6 TaxID=3368612 RepID=UPI003BA01B9A
MTAKKRLGAFIRGFCSVIELQPTLSRKAARDAIINAQSNNLHDIWSQVGDLLREAQSEFSGKKTAQSSYQSGRFDHRNETHREQT